MRDTAGCDGNRVSRLKVLVASLRLPRTRYAAKGPYSRRRARTSVSGRQLFDRFTPYR